MADSVRLSLAALLLTASGLFGQDVSYNYTRKPSVRIPFTAGVNLRRIELYISTDEGRDWKLFADADPADKYFREYAFPSDGRYWFAVRSLDNQNRYNPSTLQELVPQVKVVYDTQAPVVSLRSAADSRPNTVTAEWEARDENLDLSRFSLEWRVPGITEWTRDTRAVPGTTGALSWRVEPGTRLEIRLRVSDRAGNETVQPVSLGVGADGRAVSSGGFDGGSSSSTSSNVRYSNQLKLALNYRIPKVPPSGIPVFDLWYTRDRGTTWSKVTKDENSANPGTLPSTPSQSTDGQAGKLVFNATEQGTYGFIIVARNGVGIGDQDPKPGDAPRYWVEFDTEPPKVEMRVQTGQGYDVRIVTIQWRTTDKNLIDRPVKLFYAEKKGDAEPAEADWKPIPGVGATLDREGNVTWTVGRDGPHRFLIRATATDKANNIGKEQTKDPLVVDLEHPAVNITTIEPFGKDK